MSNLFAELAKPFAPQDVVWKPGHATKDGSKCMAMAYADMRAYMDRLDEVCGMDWSIEYQPWGEHRIMAHLTIAGVTRCSTGEMAAQDEKNGMGGTVAEAQAFKRAAAMFGLGRYLYDLPAAWVAYDSQAKKISKAGQSELDSRYRAWYTKTMEAIAKRDNGGGPGGRQVDISTGEITSPEASPQTTEDVEYSDVSDLWNDDAPAPAKANVLSKSQLTRLNILGVDVYGEAWNEQRRILVEAVSKGAISSSKELSPDEASVLIRGMEAKLKEKQAQARAQAAAQAKAAQAAQPQMAAA